MGDLSKDIGYEWELSVNSVAEALKAIDSMCGRKLFKKTFRKTIKIYSTK